MTKKDVSNLITSILVYQAWVKDAIAAEEPSTKVHQLMHWFNEDARKLNASGYGNVTLYKMDGREI
jgi:hypothetical protein